MFANELINNKQLLEHLISEELTGRRYLISELEKLGYTYVYNGGNYITIKTNLDANLVAQRLLTDKNISVKTSGYNILQGYIRVTTGAVQYMKVFMDSLCEVDK